MTETTVPPCPFCGREVDLNDPDTLYPTGIVWSETDDGRWYQYRGESGIYSGACYVLTCDESAGGCSAEIYGDSREEVIAKWSRRAGACDQKP